MIKGLIRLFGESYVVSLLGTPESSNTTLIIATAAPTGGVLLTVLLGTILYLTYAAGPYPGLQ